MKKSVRRATVKASIIAFLSCAAALPVVAAPLLANIMASPSQFSIAPNVQYRAVQVTVTGPNGFQVTSSFLPGQNPSVLLPGQDGLYKYELSFSPFIDATTQAALASARQRGVDLVANPQAASTGQSGSFRIANGSLVPNAVEPARSSSSGARAKILSASPTAKAAAVPGIKQPLDQVISDDLIVSGSICAGFDCVNGESFGFDTLRLKENNVRIKFQDTSASSTFPSNSWQLTANESSAGGRNLFSIDNVSTGKTPFTVEGNAPTNALLIADNGKIGLGTATPLLPIHSAIGNTPALRLEQNGSSGFTAQTWDIAGNEANFFIRDATNGSTLPFRIKPGAPSNSLHIDAQGRVGMGVETADSRLHVVGPGTAATVIHAQATGANDSIIRISQNGATPNAWEVRGNNATGRLTISDDASRIPFKFGKGAIDNLLRVGIADIRTVDIAGDLKVNGTIFGTVSGPSSRELKILLSGTDGHSVLEKIASLPLFTWSYKHETGVRHLGPVAEDFYARFSLGIDDRHISPNDMAGVALAATQALNSLRLQKDAQLDQARRQIDDLKARLARLESRMGLAAENSAAPAQPMVRQQAAQRR